MRTQAWPKQCACGRSHTEEGWKLLHLVGIQRFERKHGHPNYELRNCACNSTLAVVALDDLTEKPSPASN